MKDFSLLYGPARTWLVIVGTALIAVGIAVFSQGSANAQQACLADGSSLASARQAYVGSCDEPLADCQAGEQGWTCSSGSPDQQPLAQRSSSQDLDPVVGGVAPDEDAELSESARIWSTAPQSAADVPFVSLQQSPEGITDAGEDLVSANTSEAPAPVIRPPATPRTTEAPSRPQPQPASNPDSQSDTQSDTRSEPTPAPQPDSQPQSAPSADSQQTPPPQPQPNNQSNGQPNTQPNPAVPVVDDQPQADGACQGRGQTLREALRNYQRNCSVVPRACGQTPDGGWICSSGRLD